MGAITYTPVEESLIEALSEAEGWSGALRDSVRLNGLPTRRVEAWKWSDLRRAAGEVALSEDAAEAGYALSGDLAEGEAELIFAAQGVAVAEAALQVPDGVTARLVERRDVEDGSVAFGRLSLSLGEGARLEHVILGEEAGGAVSTHSLEVEIAKDARYSQVVLSFGSRLWRQDTQIHHAGEGAHASLNAVYLVGEGRHVDFTSVVTHEGPGGVTEQLVKGAAAKGGRGVFQGKFLVEQAAQQTDARMTHRALMLEEGAEIDAKPELEIYADDVQCAHGNALGALDDSALFYLRQRGIPEARARALLIESFLAEPLESLEDEALRDSLLAMLRAELEALS